MISVILLQRSAQGGAKQIVTLSARGEAASNRAELANHLVLNEAISVAAHAKLFERSLRKLTQQLSGLRVQRVERGWIRR